MITANWGAATEVGVVRQHNEDAILAQFPVFIVADGMGGHAGGEVASAQASGAFRDLANHDRITSGDVKAAIEQINKAILEAAQSDTSLVGMGTTLVGLALVVDRFDEIWLAFNIGDSRIYRYFQGVLRQVTVDHSEVQELIEEGAITQAEARVHPHRNVVTRVLGVEPSVEPDFWLLPPVVGERFLLCSDGLSGEVTDEAISEILATETEPSVAVSRLVEKALASGGHDNISAVVVDVVSTTAADEPESDTAQNALLPITHVPLSPGSESEVPSGPASQGREMIADVPVSIPTSRAASTLETAPLPNSGAEQSAVTEDVAQDGLIEGVPTSTLGDSSS